MASLAERTFNSTSNGCDDRGLLRLSRAARPTDQRRRLPSLNRACVQRSTKWWSIASAQGSPRRRPGTRSPR